MLVIHIVYKVTTNSLIRQILIIKKMEENEEKFDWQGKRKDQVEFSYNMIGITTVLVSGILLGLFILGLFR